MGEEGGGRERAGEQERVCDEYSRREEKAIALPMPPPPLSKANSGQDPNTHSSSCPPLSTSYPHSLRCHKQGSTCSPPSPSLPLPFPQLSSSHRVLPHPSPPFSNKNTQQQERANQKDVALCNLCNHPQSSLTTHAWTHATASASASVSLTVVSPTSKPSIQAPLPLSSPLLSHPILLAPPS